jgi:class 3 adenylate cyclase
MAEKQVTLLLTDMVGFGRKTFGMNPKEVAAFLIDYRRKMESVILEDREGAQHLDHIAGDATASVFESRPSEEPAQRNVRAFRNAVKLLQEIAAGRVLETHIGLYSGEIIEAEYKNQVFRFGNSFTAASRLVDLCGHFGTSVLMDRDVAMAQEDEKDYISCVGKITPKGFKHPIHIFTLDKPGIHRFSEGTDNKRLLSYVTIKNEAIRHFCGNARLGIRPDFPVAREKLYQAASLFRDMTGRNDVATERVLEYIGEHTVPNDDFISSGMKLESKRGNAPLGVQLFRLSQELLKALDREFYDSFVINREWEHCFRLEWREKGEVIIEEDARPGGIYFLTKGRVKVLDPAGSLIATVKEGDIFGEMASFSFPNVRNATIVADSDLVLYRISGEDFVRFPAIRSLFERLAQKVFKKQGPFIPDSFAHVATTGGGNTRR